MTTGNCFIPIITIKYNVIYILTKVLCKYSYLKYDFYLIIRHFTEFTQHNVKTRKIHYAEHVQSILKAKEQARRPDNEKTCETEDARLPGHCLTATRHLALSPAPHPVGHHDGQLTPPASHRPLSNVISVVLTINNCCQ